MTDPHAEPDCVAETIVERMETTGVDGVVVARGAVGKPWMFRDALLEGRPKPDPPSESEQGEVFLRHFNEVVESHGERKGINYFRKFAVRYCRHHAGRRKVQHDVNMCETAEELRSAISKWYGVSGRDHDIIES